MIPAPTLSARVFPWAAAVLGLIALFGAVTSMTGIFVIAGTSGNFQDTTGLMVNIAATVSVLCGVVGLGLGLGSVFSRYQPFAVSVGASVCSGAGLALWLLLRVLTALSPA